MKGQHQKTIRTLLSSVREYKKASLWCPVFVVLEVLMEVLVPGVMALIIDKGINGGSINYILKVGAVLILMSMLALFFGIMAGTNAVSYTHLSLHMGTGRMKADSGTIMTAADRWCAMILRSPAIPCFIWMKPATLPGTAKR